MPPPAEIALLALQVLGLVALNIAGEYLASWMHLPLPGNLVGMLILLALLSTRVVRVEWFAASAAIFTRHLAFFFVPIAVGLMAYGTLLRTEGAAILATLIASAVVGIMVTGGTVSRLLRTHQPEDV